MGEALVDLIQRNEGAFQPFLGGSPFNVAVGLARQGVNATYVSPLSRDAFGDRFASALAAESVNIGAPNRSRRPTSVALVRVGADGVPTYTLYREGVADKDVTYDELLAAVPPDAKLFHTGSLAVTPSQLDKVVRLIEHLRNRGVLISVDINIRLGASADSEAHVAGVLSLLPYCDVVKASDEDLLALALGGDVTHISAEVCSRIGQGLLVLTEGARGAQAIARWGSVRVDAYPVERVADTVGAGDVFHAAFLATLIRHGVVDRPLTEVSALLGALLEDALNFACAAAAISVERVGCEPPSREEVETRLRSARR